MTRAYAAKRLLEHGPLTFRDFMEITGWTIHSAKNVIERLEKAGDVRPENIDGHRHYAIVDKGLI